MKRKLTGAICLILALSLLCSVSAFAATIEDKTASTKITYTKEKEQSEPTPSRPVYEIAIPAEMSLNDGNTMPIYLTENNLTAAQRLDVCIDANSELDSTDHTLHLQGSKSQTPAKVKIGYYLSGGTVEYIDNGGFWQVAAFESGNVHPVARGTICFELTNESELAADTYSGTLNFSLKLITE